MASDSIKASARSGVLWGAGSQFVCLGLQLLQSVIAARILGPDKYAEIAVIYVVTAIAVPLAQSGLGVSIIYFQERDPRKIAQVQSLSVAFATVAALAVFLSAGPIADYFRLEGARLLIQISAGTIWLSAISSVWQSILKRSLIFRDVEVAYLASYSVGFVAVIALLYSGAGAASVVIGQTLCAALNAALLQLALHKRGIACGLALPGPGVRAHLAYGGMNAISALASVIGDRVDAMIIGGRFSAAAFGTYGLFTRIITALSTPIQRLKTSIEFPTYARIISERPRLRRAFEKALGLSLLLVLPVFLGIASVADLALSVGLGPQWVGYAPVLAIMCVYGAVRVASSCSTPLFMAAGLVRRALYLVFARLALMPVVILGAIATSPTLVSVALAATAAQVVVLVANYLLFVRPVLGACAGALAVTALRPLSAALLMLGAVALVRGQLEAAPDALALAAAVATGALVYCAGNLLLNRGVVRECLYIVRPLLETMFGANRGGREAGDPDAPAPAPAAKLADQR